jgi:hypothetical protein
LSILVDRKVYGAEATATNLLLDYILIYPVDGGTVIIAASIVGAGIEGLFDSPAA